MGWPARNASRFASVTSRIRTSASRLLNALCGVNTTSSRESSTRFRTAVRSRSTSSGCCSNCFSSLMSSSPSRTSSPAPPSLPLSSAPTSASVSGRLGGAGLDVLEGEELIKEEKQLLQQPLDVEALRTAVRNRVLLSREDVVFTQHNAFNSREG